MWIPKEWNDFPSKVCIGYKRRIITKCVKRRILLKYELYGVKYGSLYSENFMSISQK